MAGSRLIGQPFSDPGYFWSRPSATVARSLQRAPPRAGPTWARPTPPCSQAIADRIAALRAADPGNTAPVPIDLVTASASGLDPDISPAAAQYQVAGWPGPAACPVDDRAGVSSQKYTSGRQLGFLGEPRVNVLRVEPRSRRCCRTK